MRGSWGFGSPAMNKPVLAFTLGDPAGIGPEIVVAALKNSAVRRACVPLVIGSRDVFYYHGWRPELAPILDPGVACSVRPGRPSPAGGRAGFAAVAVATKLALRRCVDAIVTAPISKEFWNRAGIRYPDHTDYLKEATGAAQVAMMLLCGELRTVLVTRHMPLRDAPRRISTGETVRAVLLLHKALRDDLKILRPRLGLCALNPHAGEEGLLGKEEREILLPAVRRLRHSGVGISLPLPADSAWALHRAGKFDGLVTLYHDQALIPLKMADPYGVVNWTLGLPIVRTSPGHGTAFDIAGKGCAMPDAMVAAALLAARLSGNPRPLRERVG